jgi:hypothetical protein
VAGARTGKLRALLGVGTPMRSSWFHPSARRKRLDFTQLTHIALIAVGTAMSAYLVDAVVSGLCDRSTRFSGTCGFLYSGMGTATTRYSPYFEEHRYYAFRIVSGVVLISLPMIVDRKNYLCLLASMPVNRKSRLTSMFGSGKLFRIMRRLDAVFLPIMGHTSLPIAIYLVFVDNTIVKAWDFKSKGHGLDPAYEIMVAVAGVIVLYLYIMLLLMTARCIRKRVRRLLS